MPLTSAAHLDKHTSLSVPYTNRVLEEMVQNAQEAVQREQAALWRLKNVHTQFRGDDPHAPCAMFQGEEKMEDFDERQDSTSAAMSVTNEMLANWDTMTNVRLMAGLENAAELDQAKTQQRPVVDNPGTELNTEDAEGSKDQFSAHEQQIMAGTIEHDPPADTTQETQQVSSTLQDELEEVPNTSENSHTAPPVELENGGVDERSSGSGTDRQSERLGPQETGPKTEVLDEDKPPKQEQVEDMEIDQPNGLPPASSDIRGQIEESSRLDHLNPSKTCTEDQVHVQDSLAANGTDVQDHAMEDFQNRDDENDDISQQPPHRMTTRAGARAQATNNYGQPTPPFSGAPSPNLSTTQLNGALPIHPFFIAPGSALPDSSAGLVSQGLADEVRRQLSLYVQRQSEVVRQSNELLTGLRRALRLKNNVWDWCRNEGHVGEMSDGEDWVDMEKWGLEFPLRKGEEVDDDDVGAGMVAKKTRNRRAAA